MSLFDHTCYAEVVVATADALLCNIDGEEVWIPKSTLEAGSDLDEDSEPGDEGTITIPGWLAEDRGLV